MLAIIARIKVKPGMEGEFEAVASELVARVNAGEPGCKLYTLCRGEAPETYVFLERYDDEAALEAHRASAHYQEFGRRMAQFMAGKPEIQRLAGGSFTDQESGRKHELACLRMAADCMHLVGEILNPDLQRHFLELARLLTAAAETAAVPASAPSV